MKEFTVRGLLKFGEEMVCFSNYLLYSEYNKIHIVA